MKQSRSYDTGNGFPDPNPNTEYNSVNGVRRTTRVGVGKGTDTMTMPCICGPVIVNGEHLICHCGCGNPQLVAPVSEDASVEQVGSEVDNSEGPESHSPDKSTKSTVKRTASRDANQKDSGGQMRQSETPKQRIQPGRSARKVEFSIQNYHLPDSSCHTGICYIDFESAHELGALKNPIGDDEDNNKELCVLVNELMNSQEAVENIRALFTPQALAAGGGTKFIVSHNAGNVCANGLEATINFGPGEVVSCYGGFGINFRERPKEDEVIPSDRKIVLDIQITKPCGEVVPQPSLLIGWERPELTNKFPLMRGHMINHACVPNCCIQLRPFTFNRRGFKYVIHVPVFCVCSDLKNGVKRGEELTTDYGDEMCMFSPFYKDEYQDVITKALAKQDLKDRENILRGVPKQFTAAELFDFLNGCSGSDCGCEDCAFASRNMRPRFCTTMMNLGPNDIDTTLVRKSVNYCDTDVANPKGRSVKARVKNNVCNAKGKGTKKSAVVSEIEGRVSSKSPKSSGLSGARGKRQRSPLESRKKDRRFVKSKESGASVVQRMKRSPRRSALRKISVSADGGGFGGGESGDDDETVEDESEDGDFVGDGEGVDDSSDSESGESEGEDSICGRVNGAAAGIRQSAKRGACMSSSSSSGRAGYTRISKKDYMPFALVAFSDPKKSYHENRSAWVSDRNSHDYKMRTASQAGQSWADVAMRLLAGPAPAFDAASKINETLHPPPPVPPDT